MHKIKLLKYGDQLTDPFIGSATNFLNTGVSQDYNKMFGLKDFKFKPLASLFTGDTMFDSKLKTDQVIFDTKNMFSNFRKENGLGSGAKGFAGSEKKPLISKADGKALGNSALEADRKSVV